MKKTQVALAALALVASTAALADVTVSGYMDAGVVNTSGKGNTIVGGLIAPNVVNIAGGEDLGNGMKAEFLTQVRFETSNGKLTTVDTTNSPATYAPKVFNLSYVGLATEAGTFQIGRNVDALWGNAAGAFDVTGGDNMGSFVGSVINKSASSIFGDNMIKYVSPNINGLNIGLSYYGQTSAASAVGTTTKNDYSVGATYGIGALSLGAGYGNRTDASGAGRVTFLGAGYDLGIAKVNAVYLDTANLGSTTGFNVGAPVPGFAALSAHVGYYKDSGNGANDGSSTQVGAKYALSKRTTLFANYQTTTGGYATSVGLSDANYTAATAGTAFTFGVGHSF